MSCEESVSNLGSNSHNVLLEASTLLREASTVLEKIAGCFQTGSNDTFDAGKKLIGLSKGLRKSALALGSGVKEERKFENGKCELLSPEEAEDEEPCEAQFGSDTFDAGKKLVGLSKGPRKSALTLENGKCEELPPEEAEDEEPCEAQFGSPAPEDVNDVACGTTDNISSADIAEYISSHGLDRWLEDVLEALNPDQRAEVMNPPLKLEGARNPTGVVMSRVRKAVPTDQRLDIFAKINDLGEGVVDRLGTLTRDQHEAVMDSGIKIEGARNPSGVAMKRINVVLQTFREREERERQSSRWMESSGRGRKTEGHKQIIGGDALGLFNSEDEQPTDVQSMVADFGLESWCGEVLHRLSLFQRQKVASLISQSGRMTGVRNPSGVVMSRIKSVVSTDELVAIFVDINGLDKDCESQLWNLTSEQRSAVIAPGIYLQNVRNASVSVRGRISNVLQGREAVEWGHLRKGVTLHGRRCRSSCSPSRQSVTRERRRGRRRRRRKGSSSSSSEDGDSSRSEAESHHKKRRRR